MTSYSGWLALGLMIATFYLGARLKILNKIFGGLKHQLQWHHLLGLACVLAMIWHVAELSWQFRQQFSLLWRDAALVSGWVSFIGTIALIILAFFRNTITYRRWRHIHLVSVFSLFAAIFHTFLIFEARTAWEWILLISVFSLALIALLISTIFPYFKFWGKAYLIHTCSEVRPGMFLTRLRPVNSDRLRYKSGHFIYVRFNGPQFTNIWHPFTITSQSHESEIELLIKARGRDTNKLFDMPLPSPVQITGPFGKPFWEVDKNQLWISYGVGAAIFLAAIRSYPSNFRKKVLFICCDGSSDKIFFQGELDQCMKVHKGFYWQSFIGSGQQFVSEFESLKLNPEDFGIARICGHPAFQKSLKKKLLTKGMPAHSIQLEGI